MMTKANTTARRNTGSRASAGPKASNARAKARPKAKSKVSNRGSYAHAKPEGLLRRLAGAFGDYLSKRWGIAVTRACPRGGGEPWRWAMNWSDESGSTGSMGPWEFRLSRADPQGTLRGR